jgi:integrase
MDVDVFTRDDSPFWFAYLRVNGARKKVSLRPLAHTGPGAVKRVVALREAQRRQDEHDEGVVSKPLCEVVTEYCDWLAAQKKTTSAANSRIHRDRTFGLRKINGAMFHLNVHMLLTDLTSAHTAELDAARRREGLSNQTIKHEIATIRAAVKYAGRRGYALPKIALDNTWNVPTVGVKTRYLDWNEWLRVYRELDPDRELTYNHRLSGKPIVFKFTGRERQYMQDARDMLVALTMCGGRWNEVASLKWNRVDLEAGSLRLWGSKTQAERIVPLPEQLLAVLRERHSAVLKAGTADGYIFPGRDGNKLRNPSRAIYKAIQRAGLNADPEVVKAYGRATIHTLRHTFASWLLQHGADIAEVQDMLGHTNLNTTRRYAHLSKGKTAKRMGGILSQMGKTDDKAE